MTFYFPGYTPPPAAVTSFLSASLAAEDESRSSTYSEVEYSISPEQAEQVTTPPVSDVVREAASTAIDSVDMTVFYDPDATFAEDRNDAEFVPLEDDRVRTFANSDEIVSGRPLLTEEKPYIFAIMAKDITRGFPQKNVLFIRKFISKRGLPESYKIYRKNIFTEDEFSKIAEYNLSQLPRTIPEEYKHVIEQRAVLENQIFYHIDNEIENNEVYVYRVSVVWNEASEEEIRRNSISQLARNAGLFLGEVE